MARKIDLEKVFSQISSELKGDEDLIKQEFIAEVRIRAEKWLREKQTRMKRK